MRWYREEVTRSSLWFCLGWSCLGALVASLPTSASATVDGGITATFLGSAQKGRYALLLESSVQETCQYEPCVVYVLDTEAPQFKRLFLRELPGRFGELAKLHCSKRRTPECSKKVSTLLMKEEGSDGESTSVVVRRYLSRLTVWQRTLLSELTLPPKPLQLSPGPDFTPQSSPLVLSEIGRIPLHVRLRERWTAESFRTTTETDEFCSPEKRKECGKVERWEDGRRTQAWVCTGDCAGRASFVRVEAGYGGAEWFEGRSSWVEPGRLAQAALGLVKDRTIDLSSLQMERHTLNVYFLPHGLLLSGGFAHGMFANGTWFPLVVFVKNRQGS